MTQDTSENHDTIAASPHEAPPSPREQARLKVRRQGFFQGWLTAGLLGGIAILVLSLVVSLMGDGARPLSIVVVSLMSGLTFAAIGFLAWYATRRRRQNRDGPADGG